MTTPSALHACIRLLASSLVLVSSSALAQWLPLHVYYHERPPYMYLDDNGVLQGLVGTPARQAFASIEQPIIYQSLPAARQLSVLQNNQSKACAVGWFDTAKRRQYLNYSAPLYRDQPLMALTHQSNHKLQAIERADNLLARNDITALVKAGYSYGPYLDPLLHASTHVESVSSDNQAMLSMISSQHVDVMFIAPEELQGLLAGTSYQHDDFTRISLSDVPVGLERHIVCSEKVTIATLQGLNDWIRQSVILH